MVNVRNLKKSANRKGSPPPQSTSSQNLAKSASGAVIIDDQKYLVPGGKVQTIAGPDEQLMLVRTNSVSGKTFILHGQPPGDAGAEA